MPSLWATLSTAPDVGMLRATPESFCFKKYWLKLARTASESEGVTKKFFPRIIFLSASPSQAAPKSYYEVFSDL